MRQDGMQAYGNTLKHIETMLCSVRIVRDNVSEHSVSVIFIDGVSLHHPAYTTYKDGKEQSVPKRRHIKFRRRGITKRKNATFRTGRKFEIKFEIKNI